MDESGRWLVMRRMLAFLTKSCQQMSRILRRHQWSTLLVTKNSRTFQTPASCPKKACFGILKSGILTTWPTQNWNCALSSTCANPASKPQHNWNSVLSSTCANPASKPQHNWNSALSSTCANPASKPQHNWNSALSSTCANPASEPQHNWKCALSSTCANPASEPQHNWK